MKLSIAKKVNESGLDFCLLEWDYLNEQVESLHELIHEYGIAKLDGEYRNGKPHGRVTLFMIGGDAEFMCEEGVPSNQMKITFTTSCIFEGAFPIGMGSMLFPSGAKYEGNMNKCKPHGLGTFYTYDGASIKGVWLNGDLSGQVTITDTEGNTYESDLGE